MRKILDHVLLSSHFCQLIDNLHQRVHFMVTLLTTIFLHQNVKVFLYGIHNGLDKRLKERVEESGLFLIFLEDEANPISYFFKGKLLKGFFVDRRERITMFMYEVKTNIFCIFCQRLFFLDKQIGILSHPLIDLLLFAFLHLTGWFISNYITAGEVNVLKVLVGLFEIEELTFYVEGSHESEYIITQSNFEFLNPF